MTTSAETDDFLDNHQPTPGAKPDVDPHSSDPIATSQLRHWMRRYGLILAFVALLILFSILPATQAAFPTRTNVVMIIGNQAVAAIIALAIVVPLTAGILDLSVGATTAVASIATATTMSRFNGDPWLACLVGVAVGALVGATNGWVVTRFGLDPIIETLGVSILLGGLMVWYTNGTPISTGIDLGFTDFGSLTWLGLPRLLIVLIPVIAITWYVVEHTPFGRHLAAIGSNRRAAHLVGIRVDRSVISAFIVAGVLAGIAGVLLTSRAATADSVTGQTYLFPALASVFLGATTIKVGKPNVLGAVVGVFFVAFAVSGLSIAGASSWAPGVFNGLALLIALALTGKATTNIRRRRKAPAPTN